MKKYICEFIGTFILVLVAVGTAVVTGNVVATALSFGLVIVALSYTIGSISGCHVNPAVSLAMVSLKKMKLKEFFGYIVAQFLGAISASGVLYLLIENKKNLGANGFGSLSYVASTAWQAVVIEIILTFIFVMVILAVTSKKEYSNISGIIIGLTLTLVHLVGIPFTGTSVNPARSLAPAIFQGGTALSQLWVFLVSPCVGALLATLFYRYVLSNKK